MQSTHDPWRIFASVIQGNDLMTGYIIYFVLKIWDALADKNVIEVPICP